MFVKNHIHFLGDSFLFPVRKSNLNILCSCLVSCLTRFGRSPRNQHSEPQSDTLICNKQVDIEKWTMVQEKGIKAYKETNGNTCLHLVPLMLNPPNEIMGRIM